MLARERTSYLCPSLLDRWHLQCAAGLELDGDGGPGGLALRSLMGLWSPALALPGWVCLLVGVSARLECTTAELSASYPDPLATCLSLSPVCSASACSDESTAVWHVCFAARHLSMPELLKRLAMPCAMERLAPAVRCLRSVSSNERMAFPLVATLALLVRMSSTGGCSAQWVA
jgi:hypothetical protein